MAKRGKRHRVFIRLLRHAPCAKEMITHGFSSSFFFYQSLHRGTRAAQVGISIHRRGWALAGNERCNLVVHGGLVGGGTQGRLRRHQKQFGGVNGKERRRQWRVNTRGVNRRGFCERVLLVAGKTLYKYKLGDLIYSVAS